jgi:hypothetical protein
MKLTIYRLVRDPRSHHKIIGKDTLRVINVTDSFVGIGDKGEINKAEFQKLADALEPNNEGFTIQ